MADPTDKPPEGIPEPLPADALTGPAGPFPLVEQAVRPVDLLSTVATLRQHGDIDLLARIRGFARAQIGRKEEGGRNWGPVVADAATPLLSARRLATFAPGAENEGRLEWCALFFSDCVYEGLVAHGAPPEQVAEWKRLKSAEVSVLWENLTRVGLTHRHVPGEGAPPASIGIFFRDLAHVEIFDMQMGHLFVSVGGNTGPESNEVAENKHTLDDSRVYGFARLPW